MTAVGSLADFLALEPFFRIIEEGVAGLADGEHFFDLLAGTSSSSTSSRSRAARAVAATVVVLAGSPGFLEVSCGKGRDRVRQRTATMASHGQRGWPMAESPRAERRP
jgi:hypothetical protein